MEVQINYNSLFEKELEKLNSAQREAVEHTEGPVLVMAGPGTGKTQLLAARIGYILSSPDLQVSPQNILCLTYTESGAMAMRKRLTQLIGPDAYKVHIYTFHGFCNRVIQQNPDLFGIKTLQPVSDLELVNLYQELIDAFDKDHPLKRYYGDIYFEKDRLRKLFSIMKSEGWDSEKIYSEIEKYIESLPFREEYIYKRTQGNYKKGDLKEGLIEAEKEKMKKTKAAVSEFEKLENLMREAGRYDYDDMINWVINAFKQNENLLFRYKEQYLYYLVDEFQDTNGSQQEILNLLTEDLDNNPNLFVVGDDDQSIYRFQGANLKNFTSFLNTYKKNMLAVMLTENYRSTQPILEIADTLIHHSRERLSSILQEEKKLTPLYSTTENSLPILAIYKNASEEEADIIDQIEELYKKGEKLNEVAIIYRQHRLVENMVKVLEQKGIPLNIRQKINILDLPIIEKTIQIFRYLLQEIEKPHSGENLLFQLLHSSLFNISTRDIAQLSWYLGRQKNEEKKSWRSIIGNKELLFQLGLDSASSISQLEKNINQWIQDIVDLPIQLVFEKIINESGILKYALLSGEKTWILQSITTLYDFLREENNKNPKLTIAQFIYTIDQLEENKLSIPLIKSISSDEGIHFITAHSSKGLEFKRVFIFSCTSNIWEGKMNNNNSFKLPDTLLPTVEEDKVEEERRLFYVAITRAKEFLHISYAEKDKNDKEVEPSQFIEEIRNNSYLQIQSKKVDPEKLINYNLQTLNFVPEILTHEILNKKIIEETLANYKMNVTHLNKYLRCPISFYFEHILNVPIAKNEYMGFGNAVHFALERLFKTMQEHERNYFPSSDEFYSFFEQGMKRVRFSFTNDQFKRRMEYGKEVLPDYYKTYLKNWNKITVLEYRIHNAEVDGVPITGVLDKLEFDGKKVNVVDYKTGDPEKGSKKLNRPTPKDPLGGDYWRQMVFYKILLDNEKYKGWEMITGEIDFVQKSKKNEFIKEKVIVTPNDIEIVKNQIKDTYQKIQNHEFTVGCGKEDCTWCNFVKTIKT